MFDAIKIYYDRKRTLKQSDEMEEVGMMAPDKEETNSAKKCRNEQCAAGFNLFSRAHNCEGCGKVSSAAMFKGTTLTFVVFIHIYFMQSNFYHHIIF